MPFKSQKWSPDTLNWSYRWLLVTVWILEIESWSIGRAVSTLCICEILSLAPLFVSLIPYCAKFGLPPHKKCVSLLSLTLLKSCFITRLLWISVVS